MTTLKNKDGTPVSAALQAQFDKTYPLNIERMAEAASRAISQSVNRSAGQHLRQMRENAGAPTEADIYAMAMESNTAYRFGEWMCKQSGISFPPKQG